MRPEPDRARLAGHGGPGSSTLPAILAAKRAEVARLMRERPVFRMLGELPAPPRPFLRRPLERAAFILEVTRRSPSAGVLREDYDPAALARSFASVGDAVSVLTEGPFFGGALDDVRAVRQAVDLPVLRKDFVVEPWQVVESRWAGADAVLLMLSVLDAAAFAECAAAARERGMAVLTEVHTEAEMDRALTLGVPIVGINNRDLTTLEVDPGTVTRLAPRVPAGVLVVAESGIGARAEVRALRPFADAYLVGTALRRDPDPAAVARRLAYGEVKICGLARGEDARAAWECGASWGGFILAPESPRCVSVEGALALRASAPLRWAAVFVDEAPERVAAVARDLRLDAVQLQGDEGREVIAAVRRGLPPGCEIWKAVRADRPIPSVAESPADRLLVDTPDAAARGGTGRRFDWSVVAGHPDRDRLILAGGIDAGNARAAEAVGAGMLDVSSGVEEAPGRKSRGRLEALFAALRGGGR